MLTLQEKQKLQKEKKWIFLDSNSQYDSQNPKNNSHPLIQKICFLAESVSLGSESSEPVQIHFTQAESYQAACEYIFSSNDSICYATWRQFKDNYFDEDYFDEDNSLENMIAEFRKLNSVYGEVFPEGYESGWEKYDVRDFYICFYIQLSDKINTDNILIVFPRYKG